MVAVEVVSESNRPEHIEKKTAAYLDEGAVEVWVIYPDTRRMPVFRKESCERISETYTCVILNVTVDLLTLIPAPG